MDAASQLSRGALESVSCPFSPSPRWWLVLTVHSVIFNDADKASKLFAVPVLQCLQIKQMAPNPAGDERYRLVLSDGTHYVQTMLALQANHVVHDGKLVRGCIVRLKQYTPNNHKGKK